MRSLWLFPAGFLIGAALVWALVRPGASGAAPGAAPPPAPAARPAPPAAPSPAPEPTAPDDLAHLRRTPVAPEVAGRYHYSLATVLAVADRPEAFLEEAGAALARGVAAGSIQELVDLLPPPRRVPVLERLRALHPDLPWDRTVLAAHYEAAGDTQQAFALLAEQVATSDPGEVAGTLARLIALDAGRAATLLRGLATDRGWPPEVRASIASLLVDATRGDLALPFLVDLLEENPLDARALGLLETLDPAAARTYAEEGARRAPGDDEAWGRLARLRLAAGDRQGAFEAYRRASAAADPDARASWLRNLLEIDARAALPVLRELASPDDADSLGVLGRACAWNGQRKEAFEAFARALAVEPTDVEWLHHLVLADPARAAEHIAGILAGDDIEGDRDEVVGAQALARLALGDRSGAYDRFLEASQSDPNDYEWLRGLAEADPQRAARHLEQRLEAEPEQATVAGALADAYAALGRQDAAAALYAKASEGGDGSARWLGASVRVDPEGAIRKLREKIAGSPEDDEIWGALGDACRTLGQLEEARRAYDEALRRDPADWEWNLRRDQVR